MTWQTLNSTTHNRNLFYVWHSKLLCDVTANELRMDMVRMVERRATTTKQVQLERQTETMSE